MEATTTCRCRKSAATWLQLKGVGTPLYSASLDVSDLVFAEVDAECQLCLVHLPLIRPVFQLLAEPANLRRLLLHQLPPEDELAELFQRRHPGYGAGAGSWCSSQGSRFGSRSVVDVAPIRRSPTTTHGDAARQLAPSTIPRNWCGYGAGGAGTNTRLTRRQHPPILCEHGT